jgi:hypothetical protein
VAEEETLILSFVHSENVGVVLSPGVVVEIVNLILISTAILASFPNTTVNVFASAVVANEEDMATPDILALFSLTFRNERH